MSFFGFNTNGPPAGHSNKKNKDDYETFDFQETYDGLGENYVEEDDAFNDETFGTDIQDIGSKDFDFATGKLKSKTTSKPAASTSHMSYAKAAQVEEVLQPMASLWSNETVKQPQQSVEVEAPKQEKRILSLEEIEAKLRGDSPQPLLQQQQQQQQQQFMGAPPPAPAPGMMMPYFMLPPHVQQHLLAAAVGSGHFPDVQSAHQALMAQSQAQVQAQGGFMPPFPGMPQNMPQGMPPFPPPMSQPQQQQPQPQPQPQSQSQPQLQQPQQPQQTQPQPQQPNQQRPLAFNQIGQPDSANTDVSARQAPQNQQRQPQQKQQQQQQSNRQPPNSSEFPVLGASGANKQPQQQQQNQQQQHQQNQSSNQQFPPQMQQHQGHNDQFQRHHNQPQRQNNMNRQNRQMAHQQQLDNMSPEEREKFLIRQNKVHRIQSNSGFMNPRDKDFVTRFQLSQIVTDDPYNEDFYCQVYEVLNSQSNDNNMNSIAEKYLEQSGHRLGGRMKRADVALQRMQQQVSKAVSVAKERGERISVFSREGALGKVSVSNVKQPKKRLVIIEPVSNEENKENVKEYKFSKPIRSFQLSIIEGIYKEVLKLESMERENLELNTDDLIKSLHLEDKISSTTEAEINPFVSILSFDKTMKLFNRLFHFLSPDQQFKVVSVIFSNLQQIDIVSKSSYKNYPEKKGEIPAEINKRVELFQSTILKNLVFYLTDASFTNVLRVLNSLIDSETNNVLFLATTKIGLSIITILISRLELTKQESAQTLSEDELESWKIIYDKLFTSFGDGLSQVFPTYLSSAANNDKLVPEEDDSYIWQFLASLSLAGLLHHQRIIVDDIRAEVFGVMEKLKQLKQSDEVNYNKYLNNLNLVLNVMGLKADETGFSEM